ncbi:hypothetical protein FACS1894137_14560 [Spirochaetia bacterium]|nr:hypothetical protein FACS1894137_14560 [Spirochaetia bacterium]
MDKQGLNTPGQHFSPLQIGSIAEAVPPVPVESGVAGARAAFKDYPNRQVVPVTMNGTILGLISRTALEKIIGAPPDLAALLVPPLDTVEASAAIEGVMARFLKEETAGDSAAWFVVQYKQVYLGLVELRAIIEYTNTLRVRDLTQAGEIQRNLLDKSQVKDSRFEVLLYNKMAHELGGDFYRVFRSSKDRYLVGCFDVSGKNISGSLATMALGACFSALELLQFEGNPEIITRFINSLVRDVSPSGVFVTAVLFYVDFQTMTVTIHNCGLSPVLIFAPRALPLDAAPPVISYTVVDPSLPPLGIQDALGLDAQQTLPIRPGLRLSAYSDGLTDMTNSRRERYGEEKTIALLKKFHSLPQRDLRKILEREIAAWTVSDPQGAASLADDVTLVDIRFM